MKQIFYRQVNSKKINISSVNKIITPQNREFRLHWQIKKMFFFLNSICFDCVWIHWSLLLFFSTLSFRLFDNTDWLSLRGFVLYSIAAEMPTHVFSTWCTIYKDDYLRSTGKAVENWKCRLFPTQLIFDLRIKTEANKMRK